jgi:putative aldouronate transport system permease protein
MMDGCNDITMFHRIVLPMSKPIVATITLFVMVGFWNVFMAGVIYLADLRLQTLQMYVRRVVYQSILSLDASAFTLAQQDAIRDPGGILNTDTVQAVVLILATVPIVCVYPFLQKYFVHGINLGAVKG